MAYASIQDYLDHVEVTTAPAGLGRVLDVASTRVDELLVGAVYPVDVHGNPTDLQTAAVLRRAVCEQALYMLESGDTTGAGVYTQQTVGRVSWTRGNTGTGKTSGTDRYAPEAVSILHVEGLTPVYPILY